MIRKRFSDSRRSQTIRRLSPRGSGARSHAGDGRRRGIATMWVIFMMPFLAVTMLALAALFADQANRTRRTQPAAQLRQLLLAGVQAVQHELIARPKPEADNAVDAQPDADAAPAPWSPPLPSQLTEEGYTLTIESAAAPKTPDSSTVRRFIIRAAGPDQQAISQAVTFSRSEAASPWRLTQAELRP